MKSSNWLALAGIFAASVASGEVRLPALVGDGMVLQRDSKILLWGWADPGERVRIDFQRETIRTRADHSGRWSAPLRPYPAGGPYDMVVAGTNTLTLRDILIGDVWLASGQSNMEYPLKAGPHQVLDADTEIEQANYPRIRLFGVKSVRAVRPQPDVSSRGWQAVTPQSVSSFSAVAYFFGRELHERYRIPIGLIQAAWGGTVAETWMSAEALRPFPEFEIAVNALRFATSVEHNTPTVSFNAMIRPLTPFKIKGVIWYQGESNVGVSYNLDPDNPNDPDNPENRSAQYRTLFPALIRDWRREWGYDFPFVFVQLPGFGLNRAEPADYAWAQMREAQAAALSLANTAMATTIDIGDAKDLHPRNKQDFAHRLALAALKVAYGENTVHCGPTYESMQVEGNRARLRFSNLGSGLSIEDPYGYSQARGFEIAGPDRRFHWAEAEQDGRDILVFSANVPRPTAVRYAWRNTPHGNVFNKEGLPAAPFRTEGDNP